MNNIERKIFLERFLRICLLFSLLFLQTAVSHSAMVMTDEERNLLPVYCRHQQFVSRGHPNPPKSPYWESYLGDAFRHIHHYCWGLVELSRSYKANLPKSKKQHWAGNAVASIDYVIQRAAPDMPILSELHTTQGQAFLVLGDIKQAKLAFERAWKINPSYTRSYVMWAIYLQQNGKIEDAVEIVSRGLEHSPESKPLTSLMQELKNASNKNRK